MTGTRQIAYLHEPTGDYGGTPTDSTYKAFGLDPAIEDLSFDRGLARLGLPQDPETVDTVAQRFEGAFGVSFVPTGEPWWLNHFFGTTPTAGGGGSPPYSYEWSPTLGQLNSARVFAGVDFLGGTAERELQGVVFGDVSVDLSEGEDVRVTATGFYGDEGINTSLTPGTAPEPSGTPLVFHGGRVDIDTSTRPKVQSATLDLSNGGRAQRGLDAFPVDAVTGGFEYELTLNEILTGLTELERAYGGTASVTDGTTPAPTATFDLESDSDTRLTFDLEDVTPGQYGWQDLLDRDADLTEEITYQAETLTVTAETPDASAQ